MDEFIQASLYMFIFLLAIVIIVSTSTIWDHLTFKEKCGTVCFILFLVLSGILIIFIGELNESNIRNAVYRIVTVFK